MNPIWVAGEALVDILPNGEENFVIGGGAANTAKSLGALEVAVQFIGSISNDFYGKRIIEELERYNVGLDFVNHSLLPTASAEVTLDPLGNAKYQFNLKQRATFDFNKLWLPVGIPSILHIGSLATVIEPGAKALFNWASRLTAPIIFDPNIRASVIENKRDYQSRVLPWLRIARVIKLSEDDLAFLDISVEQLLKIGAELVILTHGVNGISAITNSAKIHTPAIKVSVIDTIGAGDTVGAITAELLSMNFDLSESYLAKLLKRASLAAAITCSRKGAVPPRNSEITS